MKCDTGNAARTQNVARSAKGDVIDQARNRRTLLPIVGAQLRPTPSPA